MIASIALSHSDRIRGGSRCSNFASMNLHAEERVVYGSSGANGAHSPTTPSMPGEKYQLTRLISMEVRNHDILTGAVLVDGPAAVLS